MTDARFSGVSTGACICHAGPEALAGGPIGKVRNGDVIQIEVNCTTLEASVNMIGEAGATMGATQGSAILAARTPHPQLAPNPALPDDTRLWAAMQQLSGGTWGGCVYDPDKIIAALMR